MKSCRSAVLASRESPHASRYLSRPLQPFAPCPCLSVLRFFFSCGSSARFEKDDDEWKGDDDMYNMLGGFGSEDDGSWYAKDSTSKTFGEFCCWFSA